MLGGLNKLGFNLPFSKSSCSHLYGIAITLGLITYIVSQKA